MWKRLNVLAILILFEITLQGAVPILIVRDSSSQEVFSDAIQKKLKRVYMSNKRGEAELAWEISLEIPGLNEYQKVYWSGSGPIVLAGNRLRFTTRDVTNSFVFEAEGFSPLRLETILFSDIHSCDQMGISLKPLGKRANPEPQFFCVESNQSLLFYLYPQKGTLITHSEIKKYSSAQEPWETYRVKKEKPTACFPYFVFKQKKKSYSYLLCGASGDQGVDSTSPEKSQLTFYHDSEIKERIKIQNLQFSGLFWLGLGATQLGIQSEPQTFTDLRPVISLKTHPIGLWRDLSLSGIFSYSFPMSSKLQSLSYSLLEGKLHYDFQLGDSFRLRPWVSYLRIQFEDELTRLGLTGGQSSVGLEGHWLISPNWRAEGGLSTMPFSSGVLSSNQTVSLALTKITPDEQMYGGSLQWQNINLLTATSDQIRLSQLSMQFFWRF